MQLLQAGPEGHRYPLVAPGDRATVAACLGVLGVIDDTDNVTVATTHQPGQPAKLGPRIEQHLAAGRGVAVQMPDLQAVGFGNKPLSILCEPPADWVMTVGVLSTDSLHEARAWLPTPSSFILAEPKSGWVETKGTSVGWGLIAAAAAVVTVGGWWVLR